MPISPMFKMDNDWLASFIFENYEAWNVHDQALFTWLLCMISEAVLPCVISYKHTYEVWDKVHNYFNSQMKDRVHQLKFELSMSKK